MTRTTGKTDSAKDDLEQEIAALRAKANRLEKRAAKTKARSKTDTEYLTANPANRKILLESIAQLNAGMAIVDGPSETEAK